MSEIRYLSKDEAQQVACPQCAALVGTPCFKPGERGVQAHNHSSRVNLAASQLGITLPHHLSHSRSN